MTALISVRDLTIGFGSGEGQVLAVNGVTLDVSAGERVGIVGESGSGKSTLALAMMNLLPHYARRLQGEVRLAGENLEEVSPDRLRELRGSRAAMVFQDPLTSFDPLRTIGDHLFEGMRAHGTTDKSELTERAVGALRSVGLPSPETQLARRPHELSGGMRQRALIALGLENEPLLLIADEPTTALDVTIQAQIATLFQRIGEPGPWGEMGLVMVSHSLGLIRQICTRVVVMYGGRIVEDAPAEKFFVSPQHPYSRALLAATPSVDAERGSVQPIPGQPVDLTDLPAGCAFAPRCAHRQDRCGTVPPLVSTDVDRRVACWVMPELPADRLGPVRTTGRPAAALSPTAAATPDSPVIVDVRGVGRRFSVRTQGSVLPRSQTLHALSDINLSLHAGETLALVGESGSGKSTLARIVLGLDKPTEGTVTVEGQNPADRRSDIRRHQRMQAVFQDPHGSLDPRQRVADLVAEPLRNLRTKESEIRARVRELLDEVRLPESFAQRYPHELSGGQAQRVAIARALAVRPRLVVLDEPTASLDVSIQTHVISLLREIQERHGLTYLFVSHDLAAVRELATRIAVMYLGRIVELTSAAELFRTPAHPYTTALLSAVPRVELAPDEHNRIVLAGEPPSALAVPSGCPFHVRCPVAREVCAHDVPPLDPSPLHLGTVACHFPGSLTLTAQPHQHLD